MFTGIIEEIGVVKDFRRISNGAEISVQCQKVLENTKIGDSIALNGVCQTVVHIFQACFTVQVSEETLNVTGFNSLKIGDLINLERAMTLNDRFGGHIVSGHVDGCAKFLRCEKLSDFHNLYFNVSFELAQYIVKKGSIALNGVSLTVASIKDNEFMCAIIPHTFDNTNLKLLKTGDLVNIEVDILAKYVEKMLFDNKSKNTISEDFLKENGFY